MKIAVWATLVDYKGEPILGNDGSPVNLRTLACTAFATVLQSDRGLSLDAKLHHDALCRRIYDCLPGVDLELPVEDVSTIKARINDCFPSAVLVAAAVRQLEQQPAPTPLRALDS